MTPKPQKMQHLDRDLAMGWLIRQDAPQAREIRDYIDRLRVLVRERDGLVEQLEATRAILALPPCNNIECERLDHLAGAARAFLAGSYPASEPKP